MVNKDFFQNDVERMLGRKGRKVKKKRRGRLKGTFHFASASFAAKFSQVIA